MMKEPLFGGSQEAMRVLTVISVISMCNTTLKKTPKNQNEFTKGAQLINAVKNTNKKNMSKVRLAMANKGA